MRAFIGLDISAPQKLAIDAWRQKALPALPKAVPAANFHITLAFLGNIDARQQETLISNLDSLIEKTFSLELDITGWFKKPQVLWIGCEHIPEQLAKLAASTASAARASSIQVRTDTYTPHVTLAHKVKEPPAALFTPSVQCHFGQFHLFESLSTAHGVTYPIRHTWPLSPLQTK
ncbi:RNA 2',3'-cyclic phosphodiesterase [Aestuariibacter salexigens]|uniref:RNA 2',3'-cyclic phosphodiesterase n=1 Tax=Aestuariibacter salexigens TaxID=226010 RepID=UPI000411A574|nr:RNA 2',3'-cyclic phosphodiesterase [Aestuariibacter salexigens]